MDGISESVESVRELIDIPPRVERVLPYHMRHYPEDAAGVEKGLRFRKNVREEFDRLIGCGRAATIPPKSTKKEVPVAQCFQYTKPPI